MRALVVNSGGIDSAVTLGIATNWAEELHSLYVDIGSRQGKREKKCAEYQAGAAGATHHISDLRCGWLAKHPLFDPETFIVSEESEYADGEVENRGFVVPMRNLMILSVACSLAVQLKVDEVWLGFDYRGKDKAASSPSWDKRPEFVAAVASVVSECNEWGALKFTTPLQGNEKARTIITGGGFNVDYAKTWSCYNALPHHCGQCSACMTRQAGFLEAGMKDPAPYASGAMIRTYVDLEG